MKICFLDNSIIPYTYNDLNSKHIRGGENAIIHLSNELSKKQIFIKIDWIYCPMKCPLCV